MLEIWDGSSCPTLTGSKCALTHEGPSFFGNLGINPVFGSLSDLSLIQEGGYKGEAWAQRSRGKEGRTSSLSRGGRKEYLVHEKREENMEAPEHQMDSDQVQTRNHESVRSCGRAEICGETEDAVEQATHPSS